MKQMTIGSRLAAALLLPILLIGGPGMSLPASADPGSTLIAASERMMKEPYHMEMTMENGMKSTGDVASFKPMRMKVTMAGPVGSMIIIEPDAWIQQNGTWKKMPGGGTMMSTMDVGTQFAKFRKDYTITDLGMTSKGGVSLHAYRAVNNVKNLTQMLYVDGGGNLARIEAKGMTMTFSRFGTPVSITPPM